MISVAETSVTSHQHLQRRHQQQHVETDVMITTHDARKLITLKVVLIILVISSLLTTTSATATTTTPSKVTGVKVMRARRLMSLLSLV